jgi:hypothetical protein
MTFGDFNVAVVFVFLQLLPSDGIYFEPMMTVVGL